MGKKSRQKRKRRAAPITQAPSPAQPLLKRFASGARFVARKLLTTAWGLVAALSVLLSYAVLYPRVTASSGAPIDENDIYSTPFTVSNDGLLPVHNVDFRCSPRTAGTLKFKDVEFKRRGVPLHSIAAGEKVSTMCPRGIGFSDDASVDLDVVMRFKAFWLPQQQERRFRFASVRDSSGKLQWYHKALSEQ
jgi:hypothetical protein